MADFTVRVELYKGTVADYRRLTAFMKSVGFTQTITGACCGPRSIFLLPPGEYVLASELALEDVLEFAKAAADMTRIRNGVLVTMGPRAWSSLESVK